MTEFSLKRQANVIFLQSQTQVLLNNCIKTVKDLRLIRTTGLFMKIRFSKLNITVCFTIINIVIGALQLTFIVI